MCNLYHPSGPDKLGKRLADIDWVIDVGAGDQGGRIVAAGLPAEAAKVKAIRTAPYLWRAQVR
jgi:excinuclease ABC subunit A